MELRESSESVRNEVMKDFVKSKNSAPFSFGPVHSPSGYVINTEQRASV